MKYFLLVVAIFGPLMFTVTFNKLDKEIVASIDKASEEAYTKGCYNGTLAANHYKRFLSKAEVSKCKADAITYKDVLKRHPVHN